MDYEWQRKQVGAACEAAIMVSITVPYTFSCSNFSISLVNTASSAFIWLNSISNSERATFSILAIMDGKIGLYICHSAGEGSMDRRDGRIGPWQQASSTGMVTRSAGEGDAIESWVPTQ